MTKRTFLQTIGAGVSALRLVVGGLAAASQPQGSSGNKFDMLDCTPHFTASPEDFGPQTFAIRAATGSQTFRGIPFALGPSDRRRGWL